MAQFGELFKAQLLNLQLASLHSLNLLNQAYLKADIQALQESLSHWQTAVTALMQTLETPSLSIDISPLSKSQWQQFIYSQIQVQQLVHAILLEHALPPRALPWRQRLDNLLSFDYYYWLFSIKGALAVLLLPLLGVALNIPQPTQIAVSILAVLQLDASGSRHKGLLRALGCLIGAIATLLLIGFNFQNLMGFMILFGIIIMLFSYLHHGNAKISYLGTQAAVAFILGSVVDLSPVTTLAPTIERLAGIVLGVGAAVLMLEYAFPFTLAQQRAHCLKQIQRYYQLIQQRLLQFPKNTHTLLRHKEFIALEKQIKTLNQLAPDSLLFHAWRKMYYLLYSLLITLQNISPQHPAYSEIYSDIDALLAPELSVNSLQEMIGRLDAKLNTLQHLNLVINTPIAPHFMHHVAALKTLQEIAAQKILLAGPL